MHQTRAGWTRPLVTAVAISCALLAAYNMGLSKNRTETVHSLALGGHSLPHNCGPYADFVQRAVDRPEGAPILNQAQLLWITALVESQGAATSAAEAGGKGSRPRFLVFGLGHDSALWSGINCMGRTAFLEDSKEWIGMIQGQYPDLEIHHVQYKGNMDKAEEFFDRPWVMPMPGNIGETCWDVILVDAPMGMQKGKGYPGRMESSHFAVESARRCIASGELKEVVVFLHDVERPLEKQIMKNIFKGPDVLPLGIVKGKDGDLSGYRIRSPKH